MVFARKRRQSNRRLLSQLDDFDQDVIIGNATCERQENNTVNEGTKNRKFTVGTYSSNAVINENVVKAKTLEKRVDERIDREMNNIVETVYDKIQNAILTAIDNIVARVIELAIRSIIASSGRDATNVAANSERGEHVGINTFFENASANNNVHYVTNGKNETRNNIPDEASELSVPETRNTYPPTNTHSSRGDRTNSGNKLNL